VRNDLICSLTPAGLGKGPISRDGVWTSPLEPVPVSMNVPLKISRH
jgi:hypothetical protein